MKLRVMPSGILAATCWLRYMGLTAFVVSLFLYRSYENQHVLGRWSYPYTSVLALALMLLVLCVWWSSRVAQSNNRPHAWLRLLDGAVFVWGAAYLASTLDNRDAAARILDANVFGSVVPLAAIGDWIAIGLAAAAAIAWCAPRLHERGRRVLLSVSAISLVVVAGEGVLRIRAALAPQIQGFPTYTSQQWARRHVELNSLGFRDRDHPLSAPAGLRRLLVVGDSYAFGSGIVRIEDRFGEQLASMLSKRLDVTWTSMTGALGHSHTLDELAYLERMQQHDHHAVLLLYVFNDIDYLAPVTPRSVVTEQPSSVLGRLHPARVLFLNLYLFQEIYVRTRMIGYALSNQPGPPVGVYANSELVQRHLLDLERFVELASRGDTPVWIVPFDIQARDGGRFNARYRRFTAAARLRGLPILALDRVFDGEDPQALIVNHLDRHPNELAHRMASERVADELAPILAAQIQE